MLNLALGLLMIALTCGFIVVIVVYGVQIVNHEITRGIEKYSNTVVKAVGEMNTVVKDSVVEAVRSTTQAMMGNIVGQANVPVQQHTVPPDEDLNNPAWTTWDDGDPDSEAADIGDSVMFTRPDRDSMRVAGIEDGEGIIPGVPLPDMTGEGWVKP